MQDTSNKTRKLRRAAAVTALVAMLSTATAVADGQFSAASVRGNWGFSASGTILPPALPDPTPAAAVGTINFDGSGGCFFSDTVNIGGLSASRSSTACSYEVGSDGSGTIEVLFPGDPAPTPLSFVIVDRAKEIRFIRTDLGVASGVAKRIRGRRGD